MHPHQWAFWGGKWVCTQCLTFARDDRTKARSSTTSCIGFCSKIAKALEDRRGHSLAGLETDGAPAVLCLRCGAWAVRCPALLSKPCLRAPSAAGSYVLRRVAQGKHPNHVDGKTNLLDVVPFEQGDELMAELKRLKPLPSTRAPINADAGSPCSDIFNTNARLAAVRQRLALKMV